MIELVRSLFSSDGFMPHGVCYLWDPKLLWLHVVSDGLTALAYWAIPPTLFVLVWKARKEIPDDAPYGSKRLPYDWIFLAFGVFIIACGATHFMAVWTVWDPRYWLSGGVKAVTAAASVATAVVLPPLVPRALALIRDARDSELRRRRLESANREMGILYERLREADRLKSEVVANVSHGLRTPLTLVLGPVEELLQDATLEPEVRAGLEVVQRNAHSLQGQVDELLDAARLDLGRVEPTFDDVDLSALVLETVKPFERLARTEEIELDVRVPGPLPVRVDAEKTERILLNLVSNAFKYTPPRGNIAVTVETSLASRVDEPVAPEDVVLEVCDSGPGVPPGERKRVFERFRRVGDGGGHVGGTGLGLSIVREFVEVQGGSVEVGDAPQGGACFTVRLPLRRPERPEAIHGWSGTGRAVLERARLEARASAAGDVRLVERPTGGEEASRMTDEPDAPVDGRPRLLIVEEDPDLRRFLTHVLEQQCRVRVAVDAESALAMLDEEKPDAILTGVMLPRMDGEELLRRVRRRRELDGVPVLVLTARADAALVSRLLQSGAQDYILKPVGPEELRARVGNHLDVSLTRKILQREVSSGEETLERLAMRATEQKRQLESAVREKSMLVRELHHRVKGNLQTITSLLNLQLRRVRERSAREALEQSRGRIAAMALLHEKLYQTEDPTETRMDAYLESLVRDAVQSWGREGGAVRTEVEAGDLKLDAERAVACGLLVHELVSNSLRHGFRGRKRGHLMVRMNQDPGAGRLRLEVEDDGVGLPADVEVDDPDSLGLTLVHALATQLQGELKVDSKGGVRWSLVFPATTTHRSQRRIP